MTFKKLGRGEMLKQHSTNEKGPRIYSEIFTNDSLEDFPKNLQGEDSPVKISKGLKIHPDTLPETNIAPQNGWLEYYFPFGMAYFQVLC